MSNKTKTTLIIIACVLAVALIAWLIWKMLHDNDETTTSTEDSYSDEFPLKEGSKGDKVKILQEYLNTYLQKMQNSEVKPALLTVDGIFGPNTATACKTVFGTETISKKQFNEI